MLYRDGVQMSKVSRLHRHKRWPFQELDEAHGAWSLRNRTPFGNAPAHTWSWVGVRFSAGDSPDGDD